MVEKKTKQILRCEICFNKLYYRKTVNGWVCKNQSCVNYWDYGDPIKKERKMEINK